MEKSMSKPIKLFLFLTLLFTIYDSCALRTCSTVQAAVIAPNEHLWIRAEGKELKTSPYAKNPNAAFCPVGVAFFNIYDTSNSMQMFKYIPYYTRNMNMNCVRLCFQPGYEKNNITRDVTPWEFLNCSSGAIAFVDLCKQASVYVYLDAHHSMGDNRGPGNSERLWKDYDYVRVDWINDWKLAAAAFKDEPWVLGYEICNECRPNNGAAYIKQAYIDCIDGIRSIDTKHVIFFGCGNWNNPASCSTLWGNTNVLGSNVAAMAHYYSAYSYGEPQIEDKLAAFQDAWNVPFLIGEFQYNGSSTWIGKDVARDGGDR